MSQMMFGGVSTCPRCGCVAYSPSHVCNETIVHQKETADFQKEWAAVRIGTAFLWTVFDQWLGTPRGQFASYLAHH